MADDETTITLSTDVKAELEEFKQSDESWNDFFRRCLRELSDDLADGYDDVDRVELTDTERERVAEEVGKEFENILMSLR